MAENLSSGVRVDGRYVLQVLLGDGTFGDVWRAQDTRLAGRLVAVKFLKEEFIEHATTVARFEAEGHALAQVSHPNVVAVIDRGTWQGLRYLVTEYVDGRPLSAWIAASRAKGEPAPMLHALALFDQLCAGMEAAHAVRIPGPLVHRDLKPDNVLVRDRVGADAVKIVDFGIAQLGGRSATRTGAMMGTPLYMAPEQATGNTAAFGPWTDVFALGVILTEMLTGHAQVEAGEPWWGTVMQREGSVRALLTALRPDVPSPIWDVVATCLKRDVKERFHHAGALRVAMRQAAVAGFGYGTPSDPPFALSPGAPGDVAVARAPTEPTPSRDGTLPGASETPSPAPRTSRSLDDPPVPWAKLLAGVSVGAVALAGAIVMGLVRADHARTQRLADAGVRPQAPPPVRAEREVREDPALETFLRRWSRAMRAERGAEDLAAFYAPRVRWNSSGAVDSPEEISRRVRDNLAAGGSFALDLARSVFLPERPDGPDVAAPCRELPDAVGDVIKVRARVTEVNPARTPAVGCARLEGVYLVRARRAAGALRICHESWSLDEGICASCPTAAVCRGRR